MGIKIGVPLYSNLVNLKSNTMKNTMQSYECFLNFVPFPGLHFSILNSIWHSYSFAVYFLNLR